VGTATGRCRVRQVETADERAGGSSGEHRDLYPATVPWLHFAPLSPPRADLVASRAPSRVAYTIAPRAVPVRAGPAAPCSGEIDELHNPCLLFVSIAARRIDPGCPITFPHPLQIRDPVLKVVIPSNSPLHPRINTSTDPFLRYQSVLNC
jgi:hypothetical protein